MPPQEARLLRALVDFIDDALRPAGYRIVGVFDDRESEALAVAGFHEAGIVRRRRQGIHIHYELVVAFTGPILN